MNIFQFVRLNFSLNGRTNEEQQQQNCDHALRSPDIQLPVQVEDTINKLVNNASFLYEETEWLQNLARPGTSPNESNGGTALLVRIGRSSSVLLAQKIGNKCVTKIMTITDTSKSRNQFEYSFFWSCYQLINSIKAIRFCKCIFDIKRTDMVLSPFSSEENKTI